MSKSPHSARVLAQFIENVVHSQLSRGIAAERLESQLDELAKELTGGSLDVWRKTTRSLAKYRLRVVDAIAAHDAEAAREAARIFSERSTKIITSLPAALDTMLSDNAMASLLTALLRSG